MPKHSMGGSTGYHFKGGAGSGGVLVQDEGADVGVFQVINFIGADVSALHGGSRANVYIPAASYASHFMTRDGSTGLQAVSDSVQRTIAKISTPDEEGLPFSTGGWAGTNQDATRDSVFTFSTPGEITGLGEGASLEVRLFDADGATVLESFEANGLDAAKIFTSGTGNIRVEVLSFATDANRFKGRIEVQVDAGQILDLAGREGGRVHAQIVMNTDPSTDGSGPYVYSQNDVFIDANPSTPTIGFAQILETTPVVKSISGVRYYTIGSTFALTASDIDDLNANTSKTSGNISLSASNYGIGTLLQSPFGAGQDRFSSWTSSHDNAGASYQNSSATIETANHRYAGDDATASARAFDTWGGGSTTTSPPESILVDTYPPESTSLYEAFTDESRRLESDYLTPWDSSRHLVAGEAMVFFGELISPQAARLSGGVTEDDWTRFKPEPIEQPDYSGLTAPVSYYRSFTEDGFDISSMTISITGQFPVSVVRSLELEELRVFIRKIDGLGSTGPNASPLRLHGNPYNFSSFDDGATEEGAGIRELTSSGGTISATFGGLPARSGVYMQIQILNPAIRISSAEVTFF